MSEQNEKPTYHHPVDIDGSNLVIIRRTWLGFREVESGFLSYDGTVLRLESDKGTRVVDTDEINAFQPVSAATQIPACRGFTFFRIVEGG